MGSCNILGKTKDYCCYSLNNVGDLKLLTGTVYIYILYIYVCTKKFVIERTRVLIYLKFVATDFFPKIISPSAGENSGDLA